MDAIDFGATATSIITDLTSATGPIKAAITVGALLLAVTVGWKVFKRFAK
jgi:hypothetical protein